MLINSEIYFNKPKEFNDPFDCRTNVFYQGTYDEWYAFNKRNGLSDIDAHTHANIMYNKTVNNDDVDSRNNDKEFNAIFCFSAVKDNILIWSHYADGHKGICIEYTPIKDSTGIAIPLDNTFRQIDEDPVFNEFIPLTEVVYDINMPQKHNCLKDDSYNLVKFIRTKHIDWKYEKEWRCILVQSMLLSNPIKINRSCITGIIFGLEIAEKDKLEYIKLCQDSFLSSGGMFKFYQCEEHPEKYEVIINEISV